MRALLFLSACLALAACDPQELADKAVARTAEAVIAQQLGDSAAQCVVAEASPSELRAIARDIGVEAGTSTLANIAAVATRPTTLACFAREGIEPPRI